MNVLLAEANVPYDQLKEMDEINPEFAADGRRRSSSARTTSSTRPRAPTRQPDLRHADHRVDRAASVVVVKRSLSPGFAGIDNPLFHDPKTSMLFARREESARGR